MPRRNSLPYQHGCSATIALDNLTPENSSSVHSYKQTINYLYSLQSRGMKFGLRNIKVLLRSAANPETKFRSIHIAGTNGKGSTASFLASIFAEAGYKTALYTSPHLIRFTERIRINGKEISEQRLVDYTERLRPVIEKTKATFFEATTCIAFQYFADECVDIAVVETGLGGRLDSTNVLQPLVSVITNVALDHQEYLGTTLKKIAREKGGIIKTGIPCVTGSSDPSVLAVLRPIAIRRRARLIEVGHRVRVTKARRLGRTRISFGGRHISIKNVLLGFLGLHQERNALTAATTIDVLLSKRENRLLFSKITHSTVARGLRRVVSNTNMQGRLSGIPTDKRFLFDVAHNLDGLQTLSASLQQSLRRKTTIVFGVMRDKEYRGMCRLVAGLGKCVIAVQPKGSRAQRASEVAKLVAEAGCSVLDGGSVANGIKLAKTVTRSYEKILVVGSNYVVGEALAFLLCAEDNQSNK